MKTYPLLILALVLQLSVVHAKEFVFATHVKPPSSDLTTQLYTELFKRMGHTFKMKLLPGVRVLIAVNKGQYDGDGNRVNNLKTIAKENLDNYRLVNEPIVTQALVMVTLASRNVPSPSYDEANTGRVAYLRGSKRIRKNVFAENRVPVNSPNQALNMLLAKRAESAIFFKLMANDIFRKDIKHKYKSIVVHAKPVDLFLLYPYVHKSNEALIPEMENTLREMKKDGTYQKIVDKFE